MSDPGTSPSAARSGGRHAIMVDVGYLYAAAGELLFGTSARRDFRVEADKLITALIDRAHAAVAGTLLRVYWYDAARDKVPSFDQRVIAQLERVKLRLGNLNARGQQKGVDAQLRFDMERLARHGAVTDLILVAGDEDLVPAVEEAQAFGVQVHVWGVEPPYGTNQAERLVWESDEVQILDRTFVAPHFSQPPELVRGSASPAPAVQPAPAAAPVTPPGTAPPPPVTALPVPASPPAPSPEKVFGQLSRPAPDLPPVRPALQLVRPATDAPAARQGPVRERVEEVGEHVAHRWILTRGRDNIQDLLPGPLLPPVIDKDLLIDAEKELGLSLRSYQHAREWLRGAFWNRIYREFGISVSETWV